MLYSKYTVKLIGRNILSTVEAFAFFEDLDLNNNLVCLDALVKPMKFESVSIDKIRESFFSNHRYYFFMVENINC